MKSHELNPITSNVTGIGLFALCGLVALVLVPNFWYFSESTLAPNDYQLPVAMNALAVVVMLAIRGNIGYGLILLVPISLFAVLESVYIFEYGRPSDAHLLGIIAETNSIEASNYLDGIKVHIFSLGIFVIGLSISLAIYAFRGKWRWNRNIRRVVLFAGILTFVAQWFVSHPISEEPQHQDNLNTLIVGDTPLLANNQLSNSFPLGLPFRIAGYISHQNGLKAAAASVENFRFGSVKPVAIDQREVYVLVIGETGRPDRWALNGYTRNTNPLLSKQKGVISITNMVSPWAWTRMSVPVILTRKAENNTNSFFAEKSIVSAFKEAGFKTYWLSTQSPVGMHDNSIAFHAKEADHTRFLNPIDYKANGKNDSVLLAPVDDILNSNEPKQLIILHTLGSHFNYSHRYPAEFDAFRPSLNDHASPSLHDMSQKLELNNSYDNSILYTDFVLASLVNALAATDSISALLYVADHGENLFDGNCGKSGHGHSTVYDFRVASIWWNSPRYLAQHPEKVERLIERKDANLTTGNVFHTLLDAADIRIEKEDPSRSLTSSQWQPHPRWTQTGLDFDLSHKEPVCKTLTTDNSP